MLEIKEMRVSEIIPYENNPRKNDGAVEAVAKSIKAFGFKVPIIVDKENVIVAGHTRLKAAEYLGLNTVPVIMADDLNEEQVNAFRLADNKTGELAEWDFTKLEEELSQLEDIDMTQFGFEESEDELPFTEEEDRTGNMAQKYGVPPFSVIYANRQDWLARKRAWVKMGIRSEIGRGGDLLSIRGAIQRQTSYVANNR